jgi:hypothetical protein
MTKLDWDKERTKRRRRPPPKPIKADSGTFSARYRGECAVCGGELITHRCRYTLVDTKMRAVHEGCFIR